MSLLLQRRPLRLLPFSTPAHAPTSSSAPDPATPTVPPPPTLPPCSLSDRAKRAFTAAQERAAAMPTGAAAGAANPEGYVQGLMAHA